MANSNSPSVTGVGVACEFSPRLFPGFCLKTSLSQRTLPERRSREITRHETPSGLVAVTKTRSRQTIGLDQPLPGMAVFQAIFLLADQVTGSPFSLEIPCRLGPRQQGQSSPRATPANSTEITRAGRKQFRDSSNNIRSSRNKVRKGITKSRKNETPKDRQSGERRSFPGLSRLSRFRLFVVS